MNCHPFIEAEKSQRRNVKRSCELLKVSRSACYATREGRPAKTGLAAQVKAVHEESRGRDGALRVVHAQLRAKRWKKTTVPHPAAAARADKIRHAFISRPRR